MRRRRWDDDDWSYGRWYPPSRPLEAKGGIKARSSGKGTQWWAKRWLAVLEAFGMGARLGRGRTYANKGQVLDVSIRPGQITAQVQGSRRWPYAVDIRLPKLDPEAWDRVIAELSSRAVFAAKLLVGEMPEQVEEAFSAAGASLFPARTTDLKTDCSCPDYANPCKHIGAVYTVIGGEFDADPFLLFELRGMPREELLARLKSAGGGAEATAPEETTEPEPDPLPADPQAFWAGSEPPPYVPPPSDRAAAGALLRRLGDPPFWRVSLSVADSLTPAYRQATARAEALLLALANGDGTSDR